MNLLKPAFLTLLVISVAVTVFAQAASSDGTILRSDVPYLEDGDPNHLLDIYFPAPSSTPFPILVHLHGGGWRRGDKATQSIMTTGQFYAAQNILFIAPNYRLSPQAVHPDHVEDCAAAVAWVFNHAAELGGDSQRLFVSGHSAGAHLAALLGTNPAYLGKYHIDPSQLAGVIAVDTASFDLLSDEYNERVTRRLVRQAFGSDAPTLEEASPYHNVNKGFAYPGFLILNTTNRKDAAIGGEVFSDRLHSVGSAAWFVAVDNHTHMEMASGMYDPADPVAQAVLQFILEN